MTLGEAFQLARVGVEAHDLVVSLRERNGERKADVSEPDDSHLHCTEF